jgi:hypothetical protein
VYVSALTKFMESACMLEMMRGSLLQMQEIKCHCYAQY